MTTKMAVIYEQLSRALAGLETVDSRAFEQRVKHLRAMVDSARREAAMLVSLTTNENVRRTAITAPAMPAAFSHPGEMRCTETVVVSVKDRRVES